MRQSYPAGVTTNSSSGVISYEAFYPVFAAMEEVDLVLNLHGEVPSNPKDHVTVLNAEERFLPTLKDLHKRFPKLRIVLEHCTTAAAIRTVHECGPNVVGTITAHHLELLVDNWASDVFSYCKPVAKTPEDRTALLQAVVRSKGKFFLGTDSAPHDVSAKKGQGNTAAGVFTQPYAVGYVLSALEHGIARGDIQESEVTQEVLEGFLGGWGRKFYSVLESEKRIVVNRNGATVVDRIRGAGVEVVPFRRGEKMWSIEWKS
jgi:dihydroorotase